jgi:S1-C subfamily serine protease
MNERSMKNIFYFILFLFVINNSYSLVKSIPVSILDSVEKSIVYIEDSVYIDSKKIKNLDLFKKFESEWEISYPGSNLKILDSYFMLGSGSGFFINEDGYILTNYHVINDIDMKNDLIKYISNSLRKFPLKTLSGPSFDKFFAEFSDLIMNTKTEYRICVNNSDFYDAKIINGDKKRDISLLKIEGKKFNFLKIGGYRSILIGNPVAAIGYPRNFQIMKYVDITRASITVGNISSLRNDNFAIQHTAPINPGNSGGPLIDENGIVIGINSRYISDSTIIGFAIPTSIILQYLRDNKSLDLLKYDYLETDAPDYIETGDSIFIDLDPSFTAYVNDEKIGTCPVIIKSLKEGNNTVKIESGAYHSEQKFSVKKSITRNYVYKPDLIPYYGTIILNSDPEGAVLSIDGTDKGKLPFTWTKINCGSHQIEIRLEGYSAIIDRISIGKGDKYENIYKLEKGHVLKFSKMLPDDSKIILQKGNNEYKYSSKENIFLGDGDWRLSIDSDYFSEKYSTDIQIKGTDLIFDVQPKYIITRIIFENLKKESLVFIDNENKTSDLIADHSQNALNLPVGKHWIEIRTKNYDRISFEVELTRGKEKSLRLNYSFNAFSK